MLPTFDKALTIYVPFEDDTNKKVVWYKYIVHECYYSEQNAKAWQNTELYKQNQYLAKIPAQTNFAALKEWELLGIDKINRFTVGPGCYVFLGVLSENIPDNADGKALFNVYDGFIVGSFKNNSGYGILDHYKVSGSS